MHRALACALTITWIFRKNAEHLMCNLTTGWILESAQSLSVCTYHITWIWRRSMVMPSMVRGAILARPMRRATYHKALGSGELVPQNERELRRSEGSGMLIGDPLR